MAREQRLDPEVEQLWQDFHDRVNVSSDRLRSWLLTQGSGEDAFGADPGLDLPEPGRTILAIKRKRKVDLTPGDVVTMRDTVAQVNRLLDARPALGATDEQWRHDLLDLGHDPLAER
ncbi:DUF3140 domain-containing protein [Plantactinospora sp. KBS50]|uniref:DUF3140 domain-containing protein n=1 Tax=Plantactinospora sp. KBS50 TaxID=2024580 RepID=UPI000BAB03E1|nr:DUF3140 domain-containing protein [Plantactinospora sp. KBS50]ASW55030.1 hypothetical protein CIK06_13830 [Plantactinospora sp. KBS50]